MEGGADAVVGVSLCRFSVAVRRYLDFGCRAVSEPVSAAPERAPQRSVYPSRTSQRSNLPARRSGSSGRESLGDRRFLLFGRESTMGDRRFLLFALALLAHSVARCDPDRPILPMTFAEVALDEETLQAKAAELNTVYMMELLEPDRIVWAFRNNAGLPAPGTPYSGSWEDPGAGTKGAARQLACHAISTRVLRPTCHGEPAPPAG